MGKSAAVGMNGSDVTHGDLPGHQETDVGPVCRNFLAPETRSPDAPASHDNSAGFRVGLNVLRGSLSHSGSLHEAF